MPETLSAPLSDALIQRTAADLSVRQLRDPRHPLVLRFHRRRQSGSWYLIHHAAGRTHWKKIGSWPALTTKSVVELLPQLRGRLALDPAQDIGAGDWDRVGQLLAWYGGRAERDRNLSKHRRAQIKTAIERHLAPRLGGQPVLSLDHALVDELLIWPLQEGYSLGYVRQILGVLKQAYKRAHKLKKIAVNPVAGLVFSDFIDSAIVPKDARLRADAVAQVLTRWRSLRPPRAMLLLLMLCHGTRIGETRRARWDHFDRDAQVWVIPAEHTKTNQAHRLPITELVSVALDGYRTQQRLSGYNGVYLFPGQSGRRPVGERAASDWVRAVSDGLWSAHDLRKLARTRWMDQGADYLVGELLLNHALDNLDVTYIHTHAEAQKRQALVDYHAWLAERGAQALAFAISDGNPVSEMATDLTNIHQMSPTGE